MKDCSILMPLNYSKDHHISKIPEKANQVPAQLNVMYKKRVLMKTENRLNVMNFHGLKILIQNLVFGQLLKIVLEKI
jgi:hypothetical protein